MKKTIKVIAVSTMLLISLVALSGCGLKKEKNGSANEAATENVKPIDDNKSYFISINGEKHYAGEKIKDFAQATTYSLRSGEETQKVPANKYMIGAGNMVNADKNNTFDVTPYNTTSESKTVLECAIGGFKISYFDAKSDPDVANIEVYGGIKIGSTEEEVKNAFGEPTNISESTGHKSFRYESKEVYRNYTIEFDEEGKVSNIEWKNLVFNK